VSIHPGKIQARHFEMVSAGTFPVEREIADALVDDYDALLLPGGTVNPDQLRMNEKAVGFVKAFVATGKPVAAICQARGRWSRPTWYAGTRSRRGRACAPTCATPVQRWSTRR
jgi:protease I